MKLRIVVLAVVGVGVAAAIWLLLETSFPTMSDERFDLAKPSGSASDSVIPSPIGVAGSLLDSDNEELDDAAAIREDIPDDSVDHDHAATEDPTGDLALYERSPMSSIPHHVVRGWGARRAGKLPGVVGAYVIVDPAISDEDLEKLAHDVYAYHYDADALSIRILDSEIAATYDRHDDGGALAVAHLVGFVNRNASLETDRIEIRGRAIDSRN